MAVKSISIRMEEEMRDKLSYVAEYEGRSRGSHILVLIRDSIRTNEEKCGKVDGKVTPSVSVKPPRKS
ncbi:hypothetical protein FACS1894132_08160 [Clostridia bacterium]|nr:hypothetical protein FACS1894132_08160 [Clostridia bacterium]